MKLVISTDIVKIDCQLISIKRPKYSINVVQFINSSLTKFKKENVDFLSPLFRKLLFQYFAQFHILTNMETKYCKRIKCDAGGQDKEEDHINMVRATLKTDPYKKYLESSIKCKQANHKKC